ncbi:unnamed protein product [Acanthoscelides obtectus]|uniref:Uncharacterized protein n=1 Tax=Acanthoscelides obtectus TaxID=200917 RepID=A0A9P0JXZ9_ACAOB|nr:unnamed protein product [Acanthoscelides obtectus]CAK1641123.1 hypothetical protein AOBTE_LOCUS12172 [Acanthoscelides obtectus]
MIVVLTRTIFKLIYHLAFDTSSHSSFENKEEDSSDSEDSFSEGGDTPPTLFFREKLTHNTSILKTYLLLGLL